VLLSGVRCLVVDYVNIVNHQAGHTTEQATQHVMRYTQQIQIKMSALQSDQDSSKEGRFLLAIRAYQNGQFSSIRAAAKAYDMSKSTLTACLCSRTLHADSAPNCQKLTSIEESTLVE